MLGGQLRAAYAVALHSGRSGARVALVSAPHAGLRTPSVRGHLACALRSHAPLGIVRCGGAPRALRVRFSTESAAGLASVAARGRAAGAWAAVCALPAAHPLAFGAVLCSVKSAGADLMVQKLLEGKADIDWRRCALCVASARAVCAPCVPPHSQFSSCVHVSATSSVPRPVRRPAASQALGAWCRSRDTADGLRWGVRCGCCGGSCSA